MAPTLAGAAIGAMIGNVAGAVIGAFLGLVLGGQVSKAILDEAGCIWAWEGRNWGWVTIPFPPFITYTKNYNRIANWTFWDNAGAGNP